VVDGRTNRPLAHEPVFLAASAYAAGAGRAQIERIGLRSSEVHAVNNAPNAGSRMEDLVLGPVVLAAPLPPADTGDGGLPSPRRRSRGSCRRTGSPSTAGAVAS
jgi:hypothetical protein